MDNILNHIIELLKSDNNYIIIFKNDMLIYPKEKLKIIDLINKDKKILYYNQKFYKIICNKIDDYKIYFLKDISLQKYYEMKCIYDSDTYFYSFFGIYKKLDNIIPNSYYISVALFNIKNFNLIDTTKKLRKIIDNNTFIGREQNSFLIVFKDQKDISNKIDYLNSNITISNYKTYTINLRNYNDDPILIRKYIINKLKKS